MANSCYTSFSSISRKSKTKLRFHKLPKSSFDDLFISALKPTTHISKKPIFSDDTSSIYSGLTQSNGRPFPRHQTWLPPILSKPQWVPSSYSVPPNPSLNINIITVSFNIACHLPLGIYIEVRKRNQCNGIYISKITPNSLAARDHRIYAGMLVLKVNDRSLDGWHPEKAVNYFRKAAHPKNSRIELTCVDVDDNGRLSHVHKPLNPRDSNKLSEWQSAPKRSLNSISEGNCNPAPASPSETFTSTHKTGSSIDIVPLKRFQPTQKTLIIVAMTDKHAGLPRKHIVADKKCFTSDELIDWLHQNVDGFDKVKQIEFFATELVKHALQSDRRIMAIANGKTPMMDDTLASHQKGFVSRIKKLLCNQPQHVTTEWSSEEPRLSVQRKQARFNLSMPQFKRSLSISSTRTHAYLSGISDSSEGVNSFIQSIESESSCSLVTTLFDI